MSSQLDKIEAKIDKLDSRLDNIDVTLGKNSVVLDEHQRRSLANEEQVELLKKKLEADVQPLKQHVALVNSSIKAIGILSTIVSIIYGILKITKL